MRVIDSHTEGEPTRVIVDGGPALGDGPLAERRARFARSSIMSAASPSTSRAGMTRSSGRFSASRTTSHARRASSSSTMSATIGMCGHGTIGLAVTLAHMGRLKPGRHRFETPVGVVGVELDRRAARRRSRMSRATVSRSGLGRGRRVSGAVRGDVAWGGNWFFLTSTCALRSRVRERGPVDGRPRPRSAMRLKPRACAARTAP